MFDPPALLDIVVDPPSSVVRSPPPPPFTALEYARKLVRLQEKTISFTCTTLSGIIKSNLSRVIGVGIVGK